MAALCENTPYYRQTAATEAHNRRDLRLSMALALFWTSCCCFQKTAVSADNWRPWWMISFVHCGSSLGLGLHPRWIPNRHSQCRVHCRDCAPAIWIALKYADLQSIPFGIQTDGAILNRSQKKVCICTMGWDWHLCHRSQGLPSYPTLLLFIAFAAPMISPKLLRAYLIMSSFCARIVLARLNCFFILYALQQGFCLFLIPWSRFHCTQRLELVLEYSELLNTYLSS